MEPSVSSPGSVPRLRVTRRNSSTTSTLPHAELMTDLPLPVSYPNSQSTSEDESGTLGLADAGSRLLSASLPPIDSPGESSSAAHRLRAILHRFDHPSSASRNVALPSLSDPESDLEVPPAQAARASIKTLFQHALREPNDRPLKSKLTRRASFNSMGSPKVSKSRRRSTSDEEREISTERRDERWSDLSAAMSFDRLRMQLTEPMHPISAASSSGSVPHLQSEENILTPKLGTHSPHHRVSKIPVNRGLRHSRSHHDLESSQAVNSQTHLALPFPQENRSYHHRDAGQSAPDVTHSSMPRHVTHHHSHESLSSSGASPGQSDAEYRERLRIFQQDSDLERERDWNRRILPPHSVHSSDHLHPYMGSKGGRVSPSPRPWPTPRPPGTSPGGARSSRHSLAKHDSDATDDQSSSESMSNSSSGDYHDRLKEAGREHQHTLERNWNRPHSQHSQSASHSHTHDSHRHGHAMRSGAPTENSRPHSRTGFDSGRAVSPIPSNSHQNDLNKRGRDRGRGLHRQNPSLEVPADGLTPHSASPVHHSKSPSSSHHLSSASSVAHHPRPVSPRTSKHKETDSTHEIGLNLPNTSAPPSLSLPVYSPPAEPGVANLTSSERRAPSPHVLAQQSRTPGPSSPPDLAITTDGKKGHRRSTTELSDPTGPFPRRGSLPLSVVTPDEESDGSLFADESIPPPRMSTPTFKQRHLPDISLSPAASEIPLPPSPGSPRDPSARADSDLARLRRAVTPNFTFPAKRLSPPELSEYLAPSRLGTSNSQKLELGTPSPPTRLADLPTPSSEEEEMKTPGGPNGHTNTLTTSVTKTPRFPGAFGTPALPPPGKHVEEEATGSDEIETTPKLGPVGAATQPQTSDNHIMNGRPNMTSMLTTPAPPGAYHETTGSLRRKGILKVRFDGDVRNPELFNGTGNIVNGVGSSTKMISPPSSPSSDDIPPLSLTPSLRKGLRLVDEYGRARRFTEDGEEIILDSRKKKATSSESPPKTSPTKAVSEGEVEMTPRRRAMMRQVDSLGHELKEVRKPADSAAHGTRGNRKAVVLRLTQSLSELKDDLREEEATLAASIPQIGTRSSERLADLVAVSTTARSERNRLTQKLQVERRGDDRVYATLNSAMTLSAPSKPRAAWWQRKWRLIICLLLLEMIFLSVGYQLASIHAKQVWLATHFDPFFPALYLRKSPPSFISSFGTLPVGWSAFAISGAVQRVGIRGFLENVGKQLLQAVWSWRMEVWEVWGSPATGPPVPQPWPPS